MTTDAQLPGMPTRLVGPLRGLSFLVMLGRVLPRRVSFHGMMHKSRVEAVLTHTTQKKLVSPLDLTFVPSPNS